MASYNKKKDFLRHCTLPSYIQIRLNLRLSFFYSSTKTGLAYFQFSNKKTFSILDHPIAHRIKV